MDTLLRSVNSSCQKFFTVTEMNPGGNISLSINNDQLLQLQSMPLEGHVKLESVFQLFDIEDTTLYQLLRRDTIRCSVPFDKFIIFTCRYLGLPEEKILKWKETKRADYNDPNTKTQMEALAVLLHYEPELVLEAIRQSFNQT